MESEAGSLWRRTEWSYSLLLIPYIYLFLEPLTFPQNTKTKIQIFLNVGFILHWTWLHSWGSELYTVGKMMKVTWEDTDHCWSQVMSTQEFVKTILVLYMFENFHNEKFKTCWSNNSTAAEKAHCHPSPLPRQYSQVVAANFEASVRLSASSQCLLVLFWPYVVQVTHPCKAESLSLTLERKGWEGQKISFWKSWFNH